MNAVLNRLVREGRIAGFWTNLAEPRAAGGLHVIVAPPEPLDGAGTEALRAAVLEGLGPLGLDPVVTVDRSGKAIDAVTGRASSAPPKPDSA